MTMSVHLAHGLGFLRGRARADAASWQAQGSKSYGNSADAAIDGLWQVAWFGLR